MSYVNRTNPSTQGLGCGSGCGCRNCASSALGALGMDTYSVIGYEPPSQTGMGFVPGNISTLPFNPIRAGMGDIQSTSIYQRGTAANTLAGTTPDTPSPTAQAVVESFSNNFGDAQPGYLPLDPNVAANTITFVQPPQPSPQCQMFDFMNQNPLMFILGTGALFYLTTHGVKHYQARRARKKAA